MADFNVGQTFMDFQATSSDHPNPKPKYFIGMSEANELSDIIVCFVLNTENRMDKYGLGCNKVSQKFILGSDTFSFLNNFTSIMLNKVVAYTFEDIFERNIRLKDCADHTLCRQIKNCINTDFIEPIFQTLIKTSFKNLPN